MILKQKPRELFTCADGTFSTHKRRGACNWHGGLRTGKPVRLGQRCPSGSVDAGVQLVPLDQVNVAHDWFQNRTKAYSERSVDNIVKAAQAGEFKWANLDAVTLWRNPEDDKLYVLSGHSRHEAFIRLCAAGLTAENQGFCEIPAKVVDVDLATARKMALESNTLSTKETDLERAIFYRRKLEAGADAGAVKVMAKQLEGRNWIRITAFAYLNPNGKTWAALQALDNGQADSKNVIKSIAQWIGNARKSYAKITNTHENELYDWLITRRGYGTARHQVNSEAKFKERLAAILHRRTEFGELMESLNIQESITRSPVEQAYNAQLEEGKLLVSSLQKKLSKQIRELSQEGATPADIKRITEKTSRALKNAQIKLAADVSRAGQVRAAARNEISLFAGVSGTATSSASPWLGLAALAGLTYALTR